MFGLLTSIIPMTGPTLAKMSKNDIPPYDLVRHESKRLRDIQHAELQERLRWMSNVGRW